MDTGKTIAVVGGTGALGGALAARLKRAGHRVIVGSRDRAKAEAAAAALGIEGMDNRTAATVAELVIMAVPFAAQRATVEEISGALDGKILVDATAPLVPPRVARVQLPPGGSAVAAIQTLLGPGVRVVSAFQNVAAHKLADPAAAIDGDVLVCADDADARSRVIALAGEIGLSGIDAGPICNSAAAEALTSVLIAINRKYKVPGASIRIVGLKP
jgi:hypothetical protein